MLISLVQLIGVTLETGAFYYLLDDFLSLTPHQRVDINLESGIYEKSQLILIKKRLTASNTLGFIAVKL